MIGIYIIEAIKGNLDRIGEKYVGRSVRLKKRKQEHFRQLKKNKHYNRKLQNYYNKYGKRSLRFTVLGEYPIKDLNFYEKFFIKCFDSFEHGFNCTEGGDEPASMTIDFELVSPEGIVYKGNNLAEFARGHNVTYDGLNHVVSGKTNRSHKGWKRLGHEEINRHGNLKQIRSFELRSPDGQVFKGKNLEQFAIKYGLERENLRLVLSGKRNHCMGWTRPDIPYNPRRRDFKLIDPDGNIHEGNNISKFAKEHNLCPKVLFDVIDGKINSYKGWRFYDGVSTPTPFKGIGKHFKVVSPSGEIFEEANMSQFVKKHGLSFSSFKDMISGRFASYRGWTLYKEEPVCL
jgi:hypothetical protein